MTSPFRMNPSLGPNLSQVVKAGNVWYDGGKNIVSPQMGDWAVGDDGHTYRFVKASAAITAAINNGTQLTITEPAFTAAAGAGSTFYAANNTAAPIALGVGDCFWARNANL
jgi:Flp pilus assembly secretin CpaC